MGDAYYRFVVLIGRMPFWVSSRPTVLHAERARRSGPFILAANHTSPYDVPLLMRHTPRRLDFVSITEVFRNPLVAWFFSGMNAFPVDRSRRDPATVRIILDRLSRGRVVAMFPEGRIRSEAESVVHGGSFRPGVARLAKLAGVPIVPAVVWGSGAYARVATWLPLRRTRYGVIYGEPIEPTDDEQATERSLADAYRTLYEELRALLPLHGTPGRG
jgi:1-acyl-sn-glycerol-3-phosphate acyltransferase